MRSILRLHGVLATSGLLLGLCWSCQDGLNTVSSHPGRETSIGGSGDVGSSALAARLEGEDRAEMVAPEIEGWGSDSVPWCEGEGEAMADLIDLRGEGFAPQGILRDSRPPCTIPAYRGVAARGMELEATLVAMGEGQDLILVRFTAPEVASGYLDAAQQADGVAGVAEMTWLAPATGEYVLAVSSADLADQGDFQLEVRCLDHCDLSMTRFPIVLLHGMGGTDTYLGILDYWFGVEDTLENAGFDVRITVVDAFAHSGIRAGQLVPQLDAILEETGARKLNLIAHSQGGLDGRILISALGYSEAVASLTTIASPHHGTPIADWVVGLLTSNKITEELATTVVDTLASLFGNPDPQLAQQLRELTQDYMETTFNPAHPDAPGVAYFSWAGRTCALVELECQEQMNGEIVIPFLIPTYWANVLLGAEENDGMVSVDSAIWGEFLGVLPADHYDEVGQLADTVNRPFDHLEFFLSEGQRLFEAGF